MATARHLDIISREEFNELRFIAAISDPNVQYLRQQGWDPLTLALGLGPKSGHACARFASHRRLPVNLNTIRADPLWKVKALEFLEEANVVWPRSEAIRYLYSRILKEIWAAQAIAHLQRRFRAWTYRPGNPGYLRRKAALAKTDDQSPPRGSSAWSHLLCCRRPPTAEPEEWSE
tara:strand:+ start:273 stop:797 length:525 start_codon:yes stop_codon:yes gene_type:complete